MELVSQILPLMGIEKMKLKSIAFIKSGLQGNGGGLEKYTFRLADACARAGYKVYILTTDWQGDQPTQYEIVNLGSRSKCSAWHLLRFDFLCKKWLSHHLVDRVFGLDRNFCLQQYYRAGNGVHAAYLDHRRAFSSFLKSLSFRFNPLHKLILAMEKKTFESPQLEKLFTNSEMVKKEVLRYYPKVLSERVVVVHNGVEWQEFSDPFEQTFSLRPSIHFRLNLNPDAYQFLFIGNEYHRKGLELLLRALATIKDREFQLSVVGKERNMKYFTELTEALGLENKVFFFGQQKSTTPFYQAADCLVVPSLYDPFANVTVEALALGLYVISSSKNGGGEVLTEPFMGAVFTSQEELCSLLTNAPLKTKASAIAIRNSVAHLDFSNQLSSIVNALAQK